MCIYIYIYMLPRYIAEESLPQDRTAERPGVRFESGEGTVLDAASSAAEPGRAHSIRARQLTGYIAEESLPPDRTAERPGVRFEPGDASVLDAASSGTAPGQAHSIRARQLTGYSEPWKPCWQTCVSDICHAKYPAAGCTRLFT